MSDQASIEDEHDRAVDPRTASTASLPQPHAGRRARSTASVVALFAALAAILSVFVFYPIYRVLSESFRVDGEPSFGNYASFIDSTTMRHTLYNTVTISALATVLAVLVGFCFAFLLTRTDLPGRKGFLIISVLPLITPPFFTAFAFILLFGRQGIVNQWIESTFGWSFSIFGWHGVVLAQTVALFPLAFLTLTSALSNIDTRLEEAARDLGASFGGVLRKVTIPLLTPALFSSAMLIFMLNISAFGVPTVIGGTGLFWENATMLAPAAINLVLGGTFNIEMGATLAVVMLVPSFALYVGQRWYLRNRSYITVTGMPTDFAPRPSPPGAKYLTLGVCLTVTVLVVALYGLIAAGAVTQTWGVDYSLTTRHFELIWRSGSSSIRNSIVLGLGGALVAAVLGLLFAYAFVRTRVPGRTGAYFLSMLPYALPGLAMGLGFAIGFNTGLLVLTGTWMIILINYAIRQMPFGIESGQSALAQIDTSLEEAAGDLGATRPTVIRRITFPLLRPTFIAALTFSFIQSVTDITAVILLVSPRWSLMSVDVYNYVTAGRLGAAAAMATLLIIVVVGVLAAIWRLSGLGPRILKL